MFGNSIGNALGMYPEAKTEILATDSPTCLPEWSNAVHMYMPESDGATS